RSHGRLRPCRSPSRHKHATLMLALPSPCAIAPQARTHRMHDNLTELPEALPLHRVSPAWRLLAILACVVVFLCVISIISMSVVIHGLQLQATMRPPVAPPPIAATPAPMPVTVNPANIPVDKGPADPANLPYPTHEDLRQTLAWPQPESDDPKGTLR